MWIHGTCEDLLVKTEMSLSKYWDDGICDFENSSRCSISNMPERDHIFFAISKELKTLGETIETRFSKIIQWWIFLPVSENYERQQDILLGLYGAQTILSPYLFRFSN